MVGGSEGRVGVAAAGGGGGGEEFHREKETLSGQVVMVVMDSFRLFPPRTVYARRVEKICVEVPFLNARSPSAPRFGVTGETG